MEVVAGGLIGPRVETTESLLAMIRGRLGALTRSGVTRLIIDVGANTDPIFPPNNATATLALEPVVWEQIRKHPRVVVVPAAVSATGGTASMAVLASRGGQAKAESSVLTFGANASALRAAGLRTLQVPLLPTTALLDAVPEAMDLWLFKTDAQGHDLALTAGAAPRALRRAHYVKNEVELEPGGMASASGMQNASNDACDFASLMREHGFENLFLWSGRHSRPSLLARGADCRANQIPPTAPTIAQFCARRGSKHAPKPPRPWGDVHWARNDTALPPPPGFCLRAKAGTCVIGCTLSV